MNTTGAARSATRTLVPVLVVLIVAASASVSVLSSPAVGADPVTPSGPRARAADVPGQEPEVPATSTPPTSSTPPPSSTAPEPGVGTSPTSTPSTTSTIPPPPLPQPTLPPEYLEDPRAPFLMDPSPADGLDLDIAQTSFDPRSVQVNPLLIVAARAELDAATTALESLTTMLGERTVRLERMETGLQRAEVETRRAIEAAAEARQRLAEHAVRAYVGGDIDEKVALVQLDSPTDLGIARHYAGVLGTAKQRLVRDYRRKSAELTAAQKELAAELGELRSVVAQLQAQRDEAVRAVFDKAAQLAAYEAGAHAYVNGFVFPIAAEADFIDSWGFPRSGGRWHQGTDVFADYGAPLIAAENGVLDRVGSNGLGGLRLWLIGDSGHHYYYAHLAGFAAGVVNGRRVAAGELVGYVGTSGNAVGTPPHLHIEIHPDGTGPVNPYPLLRAAYDARPQLGPVTSPEPTAPLFAPPGG